MFNLGPELKYLGALTYFFVLIFGTILGSFINSWIWRTRENIRIVSGVMSICVHCRKKLHWYEKVPILSYWYLKGKCSGCRNKIPRHYWMVEIMTPLLILTVFNDFIIRDNFSEWMLLRDIFFVTFLIVIFVYDWLYGEVLNEIVFSGVLIGFIINYLFIQVPLSSMIIGAGVGGGFFLLQYILSKGKWIGGGDVRLGFMLGIWLGWPEVLLAVFLAYIMGAIFALWLLSSHKKDMKSEIPFGTFLAVGTFITMLYGSDVISWYIGLLR